ncbi:hypothetical protein DV738_g255, partial [Chaetothyriales sp. CBS 135597]
MSSLRFRIDELELDDPEISESTRKSWMSVWNVLTKYVQPNSNLSVDEAINLTAEFYAGDSMTSCPIATISIFLGQQIPYDHPSHTKLANYLLALGRSLKRVSKSNYIGENQERVYCHQLADALYDQCVELEEGEDPTEYVNNQAFTTHFMTKDLLSKHFFPVIIPMLEQSMNGAFNQDHSEEPSQVRDAWVMGASQWIIYKVEEAFSLVQKPGDPTIRKVDAKFGFWQKKKRTCLVTEIWPYTWDQWQSWKAGFKKAAGNEAAYSLTCRNLAERAADLMSLQEKGLENGYPVSPLKDSRGQNS